jgi:predicted nucleotidyltransferase
MGRDLEETLDAFRIGLHEILGDRLVAIYVFGSAVTGDLGPASDVDFLVVTDRPLEDGRVRRLSQLHRDLAARNDWGGRLEGGYAARDQLRPWGLEGSIAAIEPGRPLQAGVPSTHGPANMLAIREAGRAIVGPPAAEILPEVDAPTLERGVRGYLEELLARGRGDGEPAIEELASLALDVTRCLYTLARRRPSSKTEAAAWLAHEQPGLEPVLTAASAIRAGGAGEDATRVLRSRFPHLKAEAERLARPT